MAPYTLPDLPYDFAALEPHISGQITELHYTKHHQAYVTAANQVLEQLAEAREKEAFGPLPGLEKTLAFNLGGHVNHSIWWPSLSAHGGDKPDGELASAIDEFFGSFEKFQKHFTAAATSIQGSGWAILAWDSLGQRLNVFQLYDQQGNIPAAQVPIVLVDVWEHAFYLQYKNVKPDYIKAWWNVVNWADAQARFTAAKAGAAGVVVP